MPPFILSMLIACIASFSRTPSAPMRRKHGLHTAEISPKYDVFGLQVAKNRVKYGLQIVEKRPKYGSSGVCVG